VIIAISGLTCTGKTTLARALEQALPGTHVSFSKFIKLLATNNGSSAPDRLLLQNLGEESVRQDPEKFTRNFLDFADFHKTSVLVIDGLRHLTVRHELERAASKANRHFLLIYLETPSNIRLTRASLRGVAEQELESIDAHPSEEDVKSGLRNHADLVIDTSEPVEMEVAEVKRTIARQPKAHIENIA